MFYDGIKLLEGAQISNMTVETGTAFPTTGSAGELFFRTDESKLYVYDGTAWSQAGSGTGGSSYTAGFGINISTGGVISSTVKSSGPTGAFRVQVGNGTGNFTSIPESEAGRVLTSNGVNLPTWELPQVSGGTVTSVGVSGGQTGLTASNSPIKTEGTIVLGGIMNIEHGGTGADSVAGIITNILPTQTNHANAALTTDGAGNLSWVIQPGAVYSASTGLSLAGTVFKSTVADATGQSKRVTVSNGDGTLSNLPVGITGTVLTSNGDGLLPTWENIGGTVSNITIYNSPSVGLSIIGGDALTPNIGNTKEITRTGTISLSGTLSVQNGGTGAADRVNAIVNLLSIGAGNTGQFLKSVGSTAVWDLPVANQTGNAGKFLTTDGVNTSWTTPAGGGTVTSVSASGGTTGLSFTGGPVTSSGTLTLSGTLSVANGGTGQTTAVKAINALVPEQAGNTGKILTTNGTSVSWTTASAGSVTSVDILPGASGLTFGGGPITSSGAFTVGGILSMQNGGTGAQSARDARINLLPGQIDNENKVLTTNGTDVAWVDLSTIAANANASGGTNPSVYSVDASGGTTGLTFSGGPVTTIGTLTLGGTLSVLNGGTGASTANDARNNLLPAQTGNTGKVLTTNGTNVSWTTTAGGSVTSVDVDGGTTGLTFTGGPVTSSGSISMAGVLSVSAGGTGATSAADARNKLLPVQTSHAGQILTTNGTSVSWVEPSTLGNIAAGNTGEIQYNLNGALGTSAEFAYDDTNKVLTLTSASGTSLHLRSKLASQAVIADFGRAVSAEASQGLTGAAGQFFTGTIAGDFVLRNKVGSIHIGFSADATQPAGLILDQSGNATLGQAGYLVLKSNSVQRLKVLQNGAWSVGTDDTSTGTAGQILTSNGDTAAPTWQSATVAAAGSLTGSALAANVTSSSLTSVGTLSALSVSGQTSLSQYSELRGNVTATASTAFDCSLGNNFVVTMNASITSLTFTNVPAATRVYSMTLFLVQDSAGSRTITWPAYVKWSGGTAPTLTTTANKTDILSLVTYDGGSTWLGFVGGLNY